MSYGKNILENIHQHLIREQGIADQGPVVFQSALNGLQLKIEFEDFDKFSFLIQNLEIFEKKNEPINLELLRRRADYIINHVNYLLENFQLVEEDTVNKKLQLRSQPPDQANNTVAYYEIILDSAGKLTLTRYQKQKWEKQRSRVPIKITEDVLEKLINDLISSITTQYS